MILPPSDDWNDWNCLNDWNTFIYDALKTFHDSSTEDHR